jgi:PRTRC genetic system protein B
MMKVMDSTQAVALAPRYALILYGEPSADANAHAYATAHELKSEKTGWRLRAGVPLRRDLLCKALYALMGAGQVEILSPNILCTGPGYLAWWCPPQHRAVFFAEGSAIGVRHGVVPHPGLVFVWAPRELFVMATRGSGRPTADTLLYNTAYWNVWERGQVCKGNAPFPERPGVDQIAEMEKAFFHSRNTHVNVKGRLVNYKGGSQALWRDLLDGKHQRFPERALVNAKINCAQFIRACVGGQHGSA